MKLKLLTPPHLKKIWFWKLGQDVENIEAATRGVLWKKVFLEISQNSQEQVKE